MNKPVLILGATSSIARHVARALAKRGHSLYLAGRAIDELERLQADLRVRFPVEVKIGFFDVEDFETHEAFIQEVVQETGELEGVVIAVGYLGDHQKATQQFATAEKIITRNFTGIASLLNPIADYFEKREKGFIIGISSVAGDRGRKSNYVYGASKGALTLYLQGLRNRLSPRGVRVLTVKPGFVDTPMTFGKIQSALMASPEKVGKKIVRALYRGRNQVYVPAFWAPIMGFVKHIPEGIFKKIKL